MEIKSACDACNGDGRLILICTPCSGARRDEAGKPCLECRGLGIKTAICDACGGTGNSDDYENKES